MQLNLIGIFCVFSKAQWVFLSLPNSRSSCFIFFSKYSHDWLCSSDAHAPADRGVGVDSRSSFVFCSLGDESFGSQKKRGGPLRTSPQIGRSGGSADGNHRRTLPPNFTLFYFSHPLSDYNSNPPAWLNGRGEGCSHQKCRNAMDSRNRFV